MYCVYAQLLLQQLTINDTLTYDDLFSTTKIGLASYHHADSVVVKSNVTEHTEMTGIYYSTANVYLPSHHSTTLDLGLFSVCICTVTYYGTACLPISIDFDFWCICSHSNMQRFFYFKGNPFYIILLILTSITLIT